MLRARGAAVGAAGMDTFVSDASFFDNTLRSAAAETTKGGLYHSIVRALA